VKRQFGQTRRQFLQTLGAAALTPTVLAQAGRGRQPAQEAAAAWPIGVCTSVKNAPVLRAAGVDYIEESVGRLLVPGKPDKDFAERLRAARECGLPVRTANCFLPGSLKCVGPQADHDAVLRYAEKAFERARQAGIRTIVFGSSGARSIPKGFDRGAAELQFVALLAKMGPLAAARDVVVALEPLNRDETNFVNTVPEGGRLVEPVQHPNIRLLADIYHMLRMDEPPAHIREVGPLLQHVHIAEKDKRTAPGVAGDDLTPYFRALREIDYRGRVSIECRWGELSEQLPVAMRTLRSQIARVT